MTDGGAGPGARAGWRPALAAASDAALAVAWVATPGGLLDLALRRRADQPLWLVAKLWLLAIALLVARQRLARGTPRRLLASALATGVLLLALAARANLPISDVEDLEQLGRRPPFDHTDCRVGGRCVLYRHDALGFRGPLPAPGERVVAMVGDSHVYGIGVAEDETIPAVLERDLRARGGAPVAVANAGIPGLSLTSFPTVLRHACAALSPAVVVALVKDDDLEEEDLPSRRRRVRESFGYRLLYAANVEPLLNVAHESLARRGLLGEMDRAAMARRLDETRASCPGARFVLATDLRPPSRLALAAWLAARPDVGWVSACAMPEWSRAPRIPGDGHWSAEGSRTIAALLAPAVADALAGRTVRPARADGCEPAP